MSWFLFMDESGHDHKTMPYEVRGGVALQDRTVWPFIRAVSSLEQSCFGVRLADFKKEFKGEKLLDKNRIEWALQDLNTRTNGPPVTVEPRKCSESYLFRTRMDRESLERSKKKEKEAKSIPAAARAPGQAEPPLAVSAAGRPKSRDM